MPLSGCKKIDWTGDFEPDGKKRARKNVKEGKGITQPGGIFGSANKKRGGGTFEFASSNELWRASLDTLDFMSFSNETDVDFLDDIKNAKGLGEKVMSILFNNNVVTYLPCF